MASPDYEFIRSISRYYSGWVVPFGNPRLITPECGSPRLIAAFYVLHRLLAPRHSPFALSSLITKFTSTDPGLPRIAPSHPGPAEELSEHCNLLPYYGLYVVVKEPPEPHPSKVFTPAGICSGKFIKKLSDFIKMDGGRDWT